MDVQTPARGRPRTITAERIADAGIDLGLPRLTMAGLAERLGVSQVALYRHVPHLQELKRLIAEAVFERWQIPPTKGHRTLEAYLLHFSQGMRKLVAEHPGLAPYLLRRGAKTAAMSAKIHLHQTHVAEVYGIGRARTRWLMSTVAFHCIALADTVYSRESLADMPEAAALTARQEALIEAEFSLGMLALIKGALSLDASCSRSPALKEIFDD